jgi:hypothetical protein
MRFTEIITVCSPEYTKTVNTLCGKNAELINVKVGGSCSGYYCVSKGKYQDLIENMNN